MSDLFSRDSAHVVDALINLAIDRKASDIHIEQRDNALRIRLRIDGMLHDQTPVQSVPAAQLIARIKVMANIDVAQTRIPQDGKIQHTAGVQLVDLRVATFPAIGGEKVVVRLLYNHDAIVALERIGMSDELLEQCKSVFARSSGFVLVSGPTGSGKTTTLYAVLAALNTPERNIITLEDPVEYVLPGITQGQVHTAIGFDFSDGMRALLRQDPDVVLVGEMRDRATAQTAIQAALTGHLVLSTVHTTDAVSVIIRLIDMGIEPFLINAALSCVIAQRLARMLCNDCKIHRAPSEQERAVIDRLQLQQLDAVYDAPGCEQCFGVGYKGRTGIFEIVMMSSQMQQAVINNASLEQLRVQAMQDGLVPLLQDGIDKVQKGVISLHELLRIAG